MKRYSVLSIYNEKSEAEIVRGLMESEGIDCHIVTDDAGGIYPQFDLTQGVALVVVREDLERAKELLASFDEEKTDDQVG
ncbi:MAG: DUF2007 domain-containing protein [candidate division WOR-3 bacterium]|nr:DUF2007 domain-containing protein [candidate division WOR-3 bacterium]